MADSARLAHATRRESGIPLVRWLSRKNHGYHLLGYFLLFIVGIWTVFPFYWQVATSLRSDVDLYTASVNVIPRALTLEHYQTIFGAGSPFTTQLRNSLVVSVVTTVISVFLGSLAGYALTRLHFFGRAGMARTLVYAYLAPGTILFIPLFVLAVNLHVNNTLYGLIASYLTFTVPFSTWMLMGYFRTLPVEMEEAAMVDGASRWTILWRIVMPLSAPAIVVSAVFAFTLSWNEFLYALVLVQKQDVMTAPIGITNFVVGDVFYWGQMMAAATIMSFPPVLIYVLGQRWVVSGWTAGAVK
jgi:multiple sugar transport system permease protein